MANIKYLPPEPTVAELRGGSERASVLVDISDLPAISRRRELNERLLDATCAAGVSDPPKWRFGQEDLELLLLITQERFGGESALLRRQAVLVLGRIDSDDAIRRLVDLTVDPAEHDGIRIAALGALGARGRELMDQLCEDLSPTVQEYAQRLRGDSKPERRHPPGQVPQDMTDRREEDEACRKGC
jgi:HEAT repeat protein